MKRFFVNRPRRGNLRRRGSLTTEWVVLFTLFAIGALAGFAALSYSLMRQHDAAATSVEGMNFPPPDQVLVNVSGSTSQTAGSQ